MALPPPPPPWVVATNVLLAIYPTITVLGLYAFPALYAAVPTEISYTDPTTAPAAGERWRQG